jgi:hypothetical protein
MVFFRGLGSLRLFQRPDPGSMIRPFGNSPGGVFTEKRDVAVMRENLDLPEYVDDAQARKVWSAVCKHELGLAPNATREEYNAQVAKDGETVETFTANLGLSPDATEDDRQDARKNYAFGLISNGFLDE